MDKNKNLRIIILRKRFLAFIVDWLITAFMINIIIVTGRTIQLGEVTRNNYLPSFESGWGYIYGFICLIACFVYMVIIPFYSRKGQTFGKQLTHLEIVNNDGSSITLLQLTFRFMTILLFEPALYNFSLVFYTMISMAFGFQLDTIFTIGYWSITIVSLFFGLTGMFGGMFHEQFGKVQLAANS